VLNEGHAVLEQQKLSHYLDIVEVELLKQISRRMDSFFTALATVHALHREVSSTVRQIGELRASTRAVSAILVGESLTVARLLKRRGNLGEVYRKAKLMATVRRAQPHLQLLLSQNDFAGALDLIQSTQDVLRTELSGITAFRHLGTQLTEMTGMVERIMESEFVRYTIGWRESAEASKAGPERVAEILADAQEQLVPLVMGLYRCGKLGSILQAYRERLQREVTVSLKNILVAILPSSSNPDKNSLADRLHILTASEFLVVVGRVYSGLLSLLQHVARVHDLVAMVIESSAADEEGAAPAPAPAPAPATSSPSGSAPAPPAAASAPKIASQAQRYRKQLVRESLDVLASITELSHARCAKLLSVRADSTSRLSLREFYDFHRCTDAFVVAGEALCHKQCISLRGVLLSLAKSFVEGFYQNQKKSLRLVLDNERWNQAKVPAAFQALVDRIVNLDFTRPPGPGELGAVPGLEEAAASLVPPPQPQLATSLPASSAAPTAAAALATSTSPPGPSSSSLRATGSAPSVAHPTPAPAPSSAAAAAADDTPKTLTINGVQFKVVSAVLITAKLISEMLEACRLLPAMTVDLLPKAKALLGDYNSITCQLVVGAGALQVAGLKSISTKHLALSASSLGAMSALIPFVRKSFRALLPPTHHRLLADLDMVIKDLEDHKREVFVKILAIMRDRLRVHCLALPSNPWDPQAQASRYMQELCKEVAVLHKVLFAICAPHEVQETFSMLGLDIARGLVDAYSGLDLSPFGKTALINDIGFLVTSLSELKGVACNMDALINFARSLGSEK
jgi:vacuolar protein sorting-associated protein 54